MFRKEIELIKPFRAMKRIDGTKPKHDAKRRRRFKPTMPTGSVVDPDKIILDPVPEPKPVSGFHIVGLGAWYIGRRPSMTYMVDDESFEHQVELTKVQDMDGKWKYVDQLKPIFTRDRYGHFKLVIQENNVTRGNRAPLVIKLNDPTHKWKVYDDQVQDGRIFIETDEYRLSGNTIVILHIIAVRNENKR